MSLYRNEGLYALRLIDAMMTPFALRPSPLASRPIVLDWQYLAVGPCGPI
jgi:hypothetical protein